MTVKPQRGKRWGRPSNMPYTSHPTSSHMQPRRMTHCPVTGKARFRNQGDAKDALLHAAFARAVTLGSEATRREEVRAYWCRHCHGWHLTSQTLRVPE